MDNARLQKALADYGANWISDWNQSGRDDVGQGICMGMCLDWVRRILNGKGSFGTEAAPRSHFYTPEEESWNPLAASKKTKRFQKQVVAQEMMTTAQDNTFRTELDDEIDNLVKRFEEQHHRKPIGPEQTALAIEYARTNLAKIQKKAYENFQTQWLLGTSKMKGWLKPQMTLRKNNFNRIRIDTSAMPRFENADQALSGQAIYDGYVRAAIDLLGAEGACGILSVGKATATSGHDLAFNVPAAGVHFYFFDPNLGEFRFKKDKVDFAKFWVEIWDSIYLERNYVWALMARFYWA